jgi:hypothetical protein
MLQRCLATFVTLKKNHTQPGGQEKGKPSPCDNKRVKAIRDFRCVLPLSLQKHKEFTKALRDAHATSSLTNKEARIEALNVIRIYEVLEDDDDDDEMEESDDSSSNELEENGEEQEAEAASMYNCSCLCVEWDGDASMIQCDVCHAWSHQGCGHPMYSPPSDITSSLPLFPGEGEFFECAICVAPQWISPTPPTPRGAKEHAIQYAMQRAKMPWISTSRSRTRSRSAVGSDGYDDDVDGEASPRRSTRESDALMLWWFGAEDLERAALPRRSTRESDALLLKLFGAETLERAAREQNP